MSSEFLALRSLLITAKSVARKLQLRKIPAACGYGGQCGPAAPGGWPWSRQPKSSKIILVTTAERFEPLVSPTSSRLYRHYSCKVLHNAEHVPQSAGRESAGRESAGRESAGRESVSYTFQSAGRKDPLHFHHVMGGYLPMLFRLSHKLGHVCFCFKDLRSEKLYFLYFLINRFIMVYHHVLAMKIPGIGELPAWRKTNTLIKPQCWCFKALESDRDFDTIWGLGWNLSRCCLNLHASNAVETSMLLLKINPYNHALMALYQLQVLITPCLECIIPWK